MMMNHGRLLIGLLLGILLLNEVAEAQQRKKSRRRPRESENFLRPQVGPTFTVGITMTADSMGAGVDQVLELFPTRTLLNLEIIRQGTQVVPAGTSAAAPGAPRLQQLIQYNATFKGTSADSQEVLQQLAQFKSSLQIDEFSGTPYKRN